MYTNIYDQLGFDSEAVYQIKIKGELTGSLRQEFSQVRITSESSDKENPVTMITLAVSNQRSLYSVLKKLHRGGLPIISMICTEVIDSACENEVDIDVDAPLKHV